MQRRSFPLRVASAVCALGLLALATGPPSPARTPPSPEARVLKGIARLEANGRIDSSAAQADRSAVTRAIRLIDRLPPARARPVAAAFDQVAALAGELTAPRSLALFGQLTANDNWFAHHGPPPAKTDITDSDGIVYRYFPATCFEFHPLANFAALNGAATSKNVALTSSLAAALVARGIAQPGGGVAWEYYFDYAGGQAPWLSGFAQAVAAQAFARAAQLLPAQTAQLMEEADKSFRTIPGRLDEHLSVGPWIKLYSFNRVAVLNAQLQTVISLSSYAKSSSNLGAASLAEALQNAAAVALPRFDTGYWTDYSLAGDASPLDYQEYVVSLLQALAGRDPRFAAAAKQFASYQTQPPLFRLANGGPGTVEFWVSKPAVVAISALGGVKRLEVGGGWHTVGLAPGHAGIFPVRLDATDWAGNSAVAEALPIVRVTASPKPPRKPRLKAGPLARTSGTLAPLVVGAGLDQPSQASIAHDDSLGAVQMTLVWPPGSSSPAPGAVAALDRLPGGTDLALDLYVTAFPTDAPGRAELASYASALASQVPALHDLILGPAPTTQTASVYEPALAAVYDAIKQATPTVLVAGALSGDESPAATLAGLASSFRASGRTSPLMDDIAFQPAPAAGTNLWTAGNVPQLTSALQARFAGTAQPGATLPIIVDGVAFASQLPAAKLGAYQTPPPQTTAMPEAAQAAAYSALLQVVSCDPNVSEVLLDRLVDSPDPGGQDGLYYADSSPKSSLAPVLDSIDKAQANGRSCPTQPVPTSSPAPTTSTTPTTPTTVTTTPTASSPSPIPRQPPVSVENSGALSFPSAISTRGAPSVHVGCTQACLFLVTLQRTYDGAPVLADRGALSADTRADVTLPARTLRPGGYRFSIWLVARDNPGRVYVTRSPLVTVG